MKLKYIDINGYGVLVYESAEIKKGEKFCHLWYKDEWTHDVRDKPIVSTADNHTNDVKNRKHYLGKILFAEKELNLAVPVLSNWREWEIEQWINETTKNLKDKNNIIISKICLKAGYNYNKAKYTEEDLINFVVDSLPKLKLLNTSQADDYGNNISLVKKMIQSLQKVPKYIELVVRDISDKGWQGGEWSSHIPNYQPKLITNSEGKQECIIKEIIY